MPPFATPHPFAQPALPAPVFEPGRAAFDWSALACDAPSRATRPLTSARGAPAVLPSHHRAAPRLLHDMQRELPALSPKLQRVAQYCMAHAATLHLCRIQDVAAASGTVPATVVRLAQRLGLHGFQELKLAFLDLAPPTPSQSPPPPHEAHAWPPEPASEAPALTLGERACQDIDNSLQAVSELKRQVQDADFDTLVRALRAARQIRFDWAGEADRTVALHLQARLRALGCHQVGASKAGAGHRGEWLVQVAVCEDKASGGRALDTAPFGPRVLRLVRGRATPATPAARRHSGGGGSHHDGATLIRCGNDSRRILTALAFCELLAAALAPPLAAAAR